MSEHDTQLDALKDSLNTTPPAAKAAVTVQPERATPGFMRYMPPLIKELFKQGVDFTMDAKGDLLIDGFYDNGAMRVVVDEKDRVKVVDKRNKATPIHSFEDLAAVNFEWWKFTNAVAKGKKYTAPLQPWLKAFIAKNQVKRQVIYVENDGQGENIDE